MKTIVSILLLLIFSLLSQSQIIAPDLLASGGGHFSNNFAQISISIGESATETIQNSHLTMTQGFQQSHYLPGELYISKSKNANCGVYPNPARNNIYIRYSFPNSGILTAEIFNLQGTCLLKQNFAASNSPIELAIGHFPDGFYILKLSPGPEPEYYVTRIEKISL